MILLLIPQRGGDFGERLLATAQDLLSCGYGSVCLIDSDSPTVPAAAFEQAIAELQKARRPHCALGHHRMGVTTLIGYEAVLTAEVFADIAMEYLVGLCGDGCSGKERPASKSLFCRFGMTWMTARHLGC